MFQSKMIFNHKIPFIYDKKKLICTEETFSFLCMPMMDEERVCNDAKLIGKKAYFRGEVLRC